MLHPKFGMGCFQGKISPSPPVSPIDSTGSCIPQNSLGRSFMSTAATTYNSVLTMTSVGRQLDDTYNRQGRGPYLGFMGRSFTELVGPLLLPPEVQAPVFA